MAGDEWLESETLLLRSLFDEGKTLQDMVQALGRTRNAVNRKCCLLSLSFTARNKLRNPVKKLSGDGVRDCLSCDEPFKSSWIGNRLCGNCKRNTSGYTGVIYD